LDERNKNAYKSLARKSFGKQPLEGVRVWEDDILGKQVMRIGGGRN
jgi:hypothetical protein